VNDTSTKESIKMGRSGIAAVNRNLTAVQEAKHDHEGHEGDSLLDGRGFGLMGINNYDDPVTIRARKYATGTHILLEEIGVETGPRPGRWSGPGTRPNSTVTGVPRRPTEEVSRVGAPYPSS